MRSHFYALLHIIELFILTHIFESELEKDAIYFLEIYTLERFRCMSSPRISLILRIRRGNTYDDLDSVLLHHIILHYILSLDNVFLSYVNCR